MKNKNIIISFLVLIIVLLSGFIIYDKVLLDDKTDVVDKDNLDNDKTQDNNGDNKIENKVDDNKENDIDNSKNDNLVNNNTTASDKIGEIEVEVIDKHQNIEKITGNYKDYTEDCSLTEDYKCTINYKFKSSNSYNSNVSVEDTYAIITQPYIGKQIFILYNGELYYNINNCSNNCNYRKDDFQKYSDNEDDLKLFKELHNIKRIKGTNSGTDVGYELLIITNAGDVYRLEYEGYSEKFSLSRLESLSKYKVEDIIYYGTASGPGGSAFKVILKDGTVLTKTINSE